MLNNEEALERARQELRRAMYTIETSTNKGLLKIAENKSDWLVLLIYMAENYCDFHWNPCTYIMPENLLANEGKSIIHCLVTSGCVVKAATRRRKIFGKGWRWSFGCGRKVTHWASIPEVH